VIVKQASTDTPLLPVLLIRNIPLNLANAWFSQFIINIRGSLPSIFTAIFIIALHIKSKVYTYKQLKSFIKTFIESIYIYITCAFFAIMLVKVFGLT